MEGVYGGSIVGVYVNRDLERKLGLLKDWIEEKGRKIRTIIIGGDFDARTREKERRRSLEIRGWEKKEIKG